MEHWDKGICLFQDNLELEYLQILYSQFCHNIYGVAERCGCRDMREEMICDRLVVGIKDTSLSERLQLDADLTLEKAKKAVRQKEAVGKQQRTLQVTERNNPIVLDTMSMKLRFYNKKQWGREDKSMSKLHCHSQCLRCGKEWHSRNRCPASEAMCHNCHKIGHYSTQCFTKSVPSVPDQRKDSSSIAYLDTIGSDDKKAWTTRVKLGSKETVFKLDTGADVTAISHEFYKSLGNTTPQESSKTLHGPGHHKLEVMGNSK